jgi:membrane fusion protein, multidrug efflux system
MTRSSSALSVIAAMVLLPPVFFTGCAQHSASQQSQGTQSSSSPPAVNVVAVESQKLNTLLSLPAQAIAYEGVDIYPKVTGFIEKITVDRGSRVKAGEIIIRLSAPEVLAQRAQAEAASQTAQSQLTSAQAKLAADEGTYQHLAAAAKTPGVVAANDLQVAQHTAAADKAEVQAAEDNVRAGRETLRSIAQLESYLDIRAPFDGIVTARNMHPGALVGPSSGQSASQPIVHIDSIGRLRLVVPVPESYVSGVREGQQVAFTVPAFPGQTFRAPIARISHDIDQKTRTMAVELDVRNPQITPGTFANVQWPIQRTYPTLFVPATAITTNLQRTFVIRVSNSKAEWVDVKSGANVNGKTEVFGDLKPGDQVVAHASDELASGTPVSPRPASGQ